MKGFDKSRWKKVLFKEMAKNISERVEPKDTKFDIYVGLEHLDSESLKIVRYGNPQDVIGTKLKAQKDDVIFGKRRAYQRKVAVADFDCICSAHAMVLRANCNCVIPEFLPYFMQSDIFMNRAVQISEGSLSPTIKWKSLALQQFLLPPLDEQKLMADTLYQLEDAIEKAEVQEQSLREYCKEMGHLIFNQNENFGNILAREKKKTVFMGKVVKNINQAERNPLENGLTRFIGLEHIEPGNIKITHWGDVESGTTFTKVFRKGQVLFGKRRAYLKKVAIAEFDGLCSGDILVLEAKPEKIIPELLPYVVQNDAFFQHAVKTSAGSLSPRTKWKDMANFELYLPEMDIQRRLLELFQQFDNAIEQTRQHQIKLRVFKKGLLSEWLG